MSWIGTRRAAISWLVRFRTKWFVPSLTRSVVPRLIHRAVTVDSTPFLDYEMEEMVSHLVNEDEGNRTSEEGIVSGSGGPGVSERVEMATAILSLTTAQCQSHSTLQLPTCC